MGRKSAQAIAPRSRPLVLPALPIVPFSLQQFGYRWPPLWWVGCHGGAGTSTLASLTEMGVDGGVGWPAAQAGTPVTNVVLVCRATASGAQAANGAIDQVRRHVAPPGVNVLGIAVVAASIRKPPRRAADRLRLLDGWVPKVWRLPWVEEYLAVDDPREIGAPPEVLKLQDDVSRALMSKERNR
jgi:hypothetical protein